MLQNFVQKRFLIDPISITYLHVAINFDARNFTKFIAEYKPVSRFLIDPIAIYMLQPTLIQVNNYEIVVNVFHISHNLT